MAKQSCTVNADPLPQSVLGCGHQPPIEVGSEVEELLEIVPLGDVCRSNKAF